VKKILLLVITVFFISCDDVFEKKIERYAVEVISPHNKAIMESGNISFSWNALDGASVYNLVITAPSFEQALFVAIDTAIVVANSTFVSIYKCSINLNKGNYQWYVQAHNSGYSSKKQIYDLTVIE
jgi:hypothetical protein